MLNLSKSRKMSELYEPIYFTRQEFRACSPACELEDMQPDFLRMLDRLREMCGFPLHLNSAFRSEKYELKKGRSGKSMHCLGRAVDIRCIDAYKRYQICQNASLIGFEGIGVGSGFVHVDNRVGPRMWTY